MQSGQCKTRGSAWATRASDTLLGVVYLVLVWSMRVFYRLMCLPKSGARVLVVESERVLLVRHRAGPNPWGLPGGALGKHEPLDQAARREVREEAGCEVRLERVHGIFYDDCRTARAYLAVLVATPLSEVRPPVWSVEIADARYFALDALPPGTDVFSCQCVADYLRARQERDGPGILFAPKIGVR